MDLLAADAVQANRGFSRAGSPVAEASYHNFVHGAPLEPVRVDERFGIIDSGNSTDSGYSWQLDKDIVLKDFETLILRNFIDRAALWVSCVRRLTTSIKCSRDWQLDVFDPYKHFSVYAIRLAVSFEVVPHRIINLTVLISPAAERRPHEGHLGSLRPTSLPPEVTKQPRCHN